MTCRECLKSSPGRIVANTRPGRANIYLDGEVVLDSSGQIAKTPTIIYNVTEGMHTVTFSKSGYSDITIIANVLGGSDCNARAVLDTSKWSYPLMLSQPSPGWTNVPVSQSTFGHILASTIPNGAEIYIDGQPVRDANGNIATTPSSVTRIITGMHIVTFRKVGYMDISITIEIQNGLYSNVYAILKPETT